MRRWQMVMVAVLVCIAAAGAADVFQTYGLDRASWAESFVTSVTSRSLYAPSVTPALKRVPAAQRAAVVASLGAAAKVFFKSDEFSSRYKKRYEQQLPDELKTPRTAKQISAELRGSLDKGIAEMEAAVKEMQGDIRKQADAAIAAAKKEAQQQMTRIDAEAAEMAAEEQRRHDEAVSREPDPDALSSDPQMSLRKTLMRFLAETDRVDYAAQTQLQRQMRRFINPDYESKPDAWKRCYRAGREACEAARSFASTWLTELK
jgi:hypothetical protein